MHRYRLEIREGEGQRTIFLTESAPVTVGRHGENGVVVTHPLVSAHHAEIALGEEGPVLRDLGSKNGTWVNGDQVEHARVLKNGDQIRVGNDVLHVVKDETPVRDKDSMRLTRPTLFDAESHEDVTGTVDHASVIDLAEVLVENCLTVEQRPDTTRAVVSAVDELLDRAGLSQPYLKRADVVRVRSIADRVVTWWPDGDMVPWRQGLESRLSAAMERSMTPPPRHIGGN